MSGGKSGDKTKFIIFKISDDKKTVVIDEASKEQDYEVFRSKLESARDSNGKPAPRYAVYDVEYELSGGEGKRYVFLGVLHGEEVFVANLFALTGARSSSSLGSPRIPLCWYVTPSLFSHFLIVDQLALTLLVFSGPCFTPAPGRT